MNNFREWFRLQETLALKGDYKGSFFQRLVAAAYQIAPSKEPEAVAGYRDLFQKIQRQNEFLRHKYNFIPDPGDHYRSMKQLKKSIEGQWASGKKRADMYVYAAPPGGEETEKGHPMLSNDENIIIRGVHDAIAHIAGSHPFSARGEYGAYNRHLKTLCNMEQAQGGRCEAAKVLFTEIVGQTSYYYIYGDYPAQKAVILRDFDHYRVGALAPSSPLNSFFVLQGKDLVPVPDADLSQFYALPIGREFARQDQVSKFAKLSRLPGGGQGGQIAGTA